MSLLLLSQVTFVRQIRVLGIFLEGSRFAVDLMCLLSKQISCLGQDLGPSSSFLYARELYQAQVKVLMLKI